MATSATHSGTRNMKVWISEMARPNLRLLVSIPGMDCHLPVLSDDGERVFYECEGDKGGIYMSRFDGTGAPALVLERGAPDIRVLPTSLTPDGSDLLFIGLKGRIVSGMVLRMATGGEGVPSISPLIPGREGVMGGRLSPDGKWVAVLCTKTGRLELYLQRFEGGAGVGRKIPVTTGSVDPVRWFWAKETTGNILEFLYTVEDILYSITIKAGLNPAVSEPRRILDLEEHRVRGLTSLPGRRFLVTQNTADEAPAQINFVLNFHEEIRRKFAELEQ